MDNRSKKVRGKISNLLIRLVSFLLMTKIAQVFAAMVAATMGRLAMVKARGMLFTVVVVSLTRLKLEFHPASSICSPSSTSILMGMLFTVVVVSLKFTATNTPSPTQLHTLQYSSVDAVALEVTRALNNCQC